MRDGSRKVGKAHEVHATLDDGMLDAKEFGDAGFHWSSLI
jgi:hypothetical protein